MQLVREMFAFSISRDYEFNPTSRVELAAYVQGARFLSGHSSRLLNVVKNHVELN